MSTTLATGRRFALLTAAAAMLFALLPTAPADADTGAIALEIEVTLNDSIYAGWNGTGSLMGSAYGADVGGTTAEGVPVTGTFTYTSQLSNTHAIGSITIDGETCGFDWARAGAVVVFYFLSGCTGTGVGSYVPTSAPDSIPATGRIVATGYWTH